MLRNKKWLSGILAVFALLVMGGLTSQAMDPDQQAASRASSVGSARASSSAELIMFIAGQPVTTADLAENRRLVETNLDFMRQEVNRDPQHAAFLIGFIELLEQYDPTTIALAGLLTERAVVQHAQLAGYSATAEEVAAMVTKEKALIASNSEATVAARAYIDSIGAETYWHERFPTIAKQEITIHKLWSATTAGIVGLAERERVWEELERSVVTDADIEIVQPETVTSTDVEAALTYLDRYWER